MVKPVGMDDESTEHSHTQTHTHTKSDTEINSIWAD